jgi:hypothetical protein
MIYIICILSIFVGIFGTYNGIISSYKLYITYNSIDNINLITINLITIILIGFSLHIGYIGYIMLYWLIDRAKTDKDIFKGVNVLYNAYNSYISFSTTNVNEKNSYWINHYSKWLKNIKDIELGLEIMITIFESYAAKTYKNNEEGKKFYACISNIQKALEIMKSNIIILHDTFDDACKKYKIMLNINTRYEFYEALINYSESSYKAGEAIDKVLFTRCPKDIYTSHNIIISSIPDLIQYYNNVFCISSEKYTNYQIDKAKNKALTFFTAINIISNKPDIIGYALKTSGYAIVSSYNNFDIYDLHSAEADAIKT